MRVLQVSAEMFPLLKTGGLADVAGALPPALVAAGCDVRVLLPAFPQIAQGVGGSELVAEIAAPWGDTAQLRLGTLPGPQAIPAYLIDAPALYGRGGNPYQDELQQPYVDNHRRFALLGWVAALLAEGVDPAWRPRIVHSHDWHAGLAPAYLAFPRTSEPRRAASVHTVHNLAYQGVFPADTFADLGLPPSALSMDGIEFHGQISFMKAGLFYADRITTVSPTYAREIQTEAQGCGLHGLLASRGGSLSGILNAVDPAVWNPAADRSLAHPFDARRTAGKARCKAALQKELGLFLLPDAPLFSVVSRLTEQKGLHLVLGGIDELLARGGQLVVLGSGDAALENALAKRAAERPDAVAVRLGYDEALSHRIFGASDVTLVPSRFEPCGLTQMYGLKYGSLPLVHRVGGLADTVVDSSLENIAGDSASGFVFDEFTDAGFQRALRRAFALYARRADWTAVRRRGMGQRFDRAGAAQQYLAVYTEAINAV
ncbi:MAG: glycogen synthase GlgA [Burkholderiales bacterium]